jgi:hypothetical protein
MKAAAIFNEHIPAFEQLLEKIDVEKISTDTYCQKYLGHLLSHKRYYLAIYADVLQKLSAHSDKQFQEIILIDFGAGNGLLGIFAKFCGFKKVYVNDIDEKFVTAAANLATQLQIFIDGFITGDIQAVEQYFNAEVPAAIVATDVIEHIYNLEHFFRTIKKINTSIVSVFTTASNPRNYFKIKQLKKLQLKDEYEGGDPDDFILFGDQPLAPFFTTRQEIIRSRLDNVNEELLLTLSKATRGMNEKDILDAINDYKSTGKMPSSLAHPTNTCNPLNGSWTERILSLGEYHALYNSSGMNLTVYNGFYNNFKKGWAGVLNKLLNIAVHSPGRHFAPYIIFVGTKK